MRSKITLRVLQGLCALFALVFLVQLTRAIRSGPVEITLQVPEPPREPETEPPEAGRSGPVPSMPAPRPPLPMPPPGGMPVPGRNPGGPELPPDIQARVDHIVQQELLGAVPRPLPMALLGIAGTNVMFRAPNGQMGLLGVGEELGGVELLKIGTNRILIRHENQEKELVLFSGYGGDSLLLDGKE